MILLPNSPIPKINQNKNYLFIHFLNYKNHIKHKNTKINKTTLNILKLYNKTPQKTKNKPILHLQQQKL